MSHTQSSNTYNRMSSKILVSAVDDDNYTRLSFDVGIPVQVTGFVYLCLRCKASQSGRSASKQHRPHGKQWMPRTVKMRMSYCLTLQRTVRRRRAVSRYLSCGRMISLNTHDQVFFILPTFKKCLKTNVHSFGTRIEKQTNKQTRTIKVSEMAGTTRVEVTGRTA